MIKITSIRVLIVCVCVLSVTALVAQDKAHAPPSYPRPDFTSATAYPVVRVVDGDTIKVQIDDEDVTVRICGVDTPETVHPRKPVEHYGREASRFLSNLLTGESVYLLHDPDQPAKDRFGRIVAYVFRAPDGLFVDVEIIRQGYGHVYTKKPSQYMGLFRYYQRAAREARRGLWGEAYIPSNPSG